MPSQNVLAAHRAGNRGGGGWNDDNVALLKKLWADGLSASQIATKIGEVTRNAVIGKVHRLGHAFRATTSRPRTVRPRSNDARSPRRAAQESNFIFGQQARRAAERACRRPAPARRMLLQQLPELGPAPEGTVTVALLSERTCHWPVGDPMEAGFHFCGRHKSSGVPYCEHHAAIAYNPAARRRRAVHA